VWEESDFVETLEKKLGKQATQDLKVVKAWSSMVQNYNDDLFEASAVGCEASARTTGKIRLPVPVYSHHPGAWGVHRSTLLDVCDFAHVHPSSGECSLWCMLALSPNRLSPLL
jgi:hypothetical protein